DVLEPQAEARVVQGVDAIEQRDGLARLVPLQVSHEVPAHSLGAQILQRADLRLRLLDLVLPEVPQAHREAVADGLGPEGLAHGDEGDVFGFAAGARRGSGDPFPEGGHAFRDHFFGFSAATSPCAFATFWVFFGESERYFSRYARASSVLPWLT